MKLVTLKIDVTKVDKARLFKGSKGTYLDCQVFLEDEQDQYGNNGMITQAVSKEERQSGVKGAILGNAKIVWEEDRPTYNGGQTTDQRRAPAQYAPFEDDEDSEIPFYKK
jgi:hypothetical protein